ncbi:MAG: NAD(P)H-dependent oxidoreductase [Pseudomonadota bacterium]
MTQTVLRIDSSARKNGSVSRDLAARIAGRIDGAEVIVRDLADTPVPQVTENWVNANFTPVEARSEEQVQTLSFSDELIGEIKAADTLVIGVPIYNFGVPAALKAWIDHIARAGVTFKYTEQGPVGLLDGKRAIVVIASGGTKSGSEIDFATNYVRHVLGFVGIRDVEVVAADQLMLDAETTLKSASEQVEALEFAA